MLIFFVLLTCILVAIVLFLGKELIKKFGFWEQFLHHYTQVARWQYHGGKTPQMYTLELRSENDFHALIGFNLSFGPLKHLGYDVFGYIASENGVAYIDVFLGKGGVEFIFLLEDIASEQLQITLVENTESKKTQYTFKPHFWQKIGFFG